MHPRQRSRIAPQDPAAQRCVERREKATASEHGLRVAHTLVDNTFTFNDSQKLALAAKLKEIELDAKLFLDMLRPFWGNFREMLSGNDENKLAKRKELEDKIANDSSFMAAQYALIEIDPLLFPVSSKITFDLLNDSWASYRWLQIQNLFALDLCFRYPNSEIVSKSGKAFEKLKHDILDSQYLIVALLEGSFATNERKLIDWWRLLKPSGVLLTTIES